MLVLIDALTDVQKDFARSHLKTVLRLRHDNN